MKTLIILSLCSISLFAQAIPQGPRIALPLINCERQLLKIDDNLSVPIEVISIKVNDLEGIIPAKLRDLKALSMRAPAEDHICEKLNSIPADSEYVFFDHTVNSSMRNSYIYVYEEHTLSVFGSGQFLKLRGEKRICPNSGPFCFQWLFFRRPVNRAAEFDESFSLGPTRAFDNDDVPRLDRRL